MWLVHAVKTATNPEVHQAARDVEPVRSGLAAGRDENRNRDDREHCREDDATGAINLLLPPRISDVREISLAVTLARLDSEEQACRGGPVKNKITERGSQPQENERHERTQKKKDSAKQRRPT